MIESADEDLSATSLLLKMAFQAQSGVALGKHLGIHRAVRMVTGGAPFAHRLVFKNVRPSLLGMARQADSVSTRQGRSPALDGGPAMGIVAVAATDLPLHDGMTVRQVERSTNVQVTGVTRVWRPARTDDRAGFATGFGVEAARAVARLAAGLPGIGPFGNQVRVACGLEAVHDVLVAFRTGRRSDVLGTGNRQWHVDRAAGGATGNGDQCRQGT